MMDYVEENPTTSTTLGGGTPAHWDASRGEARQRGGPNIEKVLKSSKPNLYKGRTVTGVRVEQLQE